MTVQEQLVQDMKAAMKQKERIRLGAIRQIRSTIKNKEIELGKTLEDQEVLQVITTLVKQQ